MAQQVKQAPKQAAPVKPAPKTPVQQPTKPTKK